MKVKSKTYEVTGVTARLGRCCIYLSWVDDDGTRGTSSFIVPGPLADRVFAVESPVRANAARLAVAEDVAREHIEKLSQDVRGLAVLSKAHTEEVIS